MLEWLINAAFLRLNNSQEVCIDTIFEISLEALAKQVINIGEWKKMRVYALTIVSELCILIILRGNSLS